MKSGGKTAARSPAVCPRYSAASATDNIESHITFGSVWTDSRAKPISPGRKWIYGPPLLSTSSQQVVGDTMWARWRVGSSRGNGLVARVVGVVVEMTCKFLEFSRTWTATTQLVESDPVELSIPWLCLIDLSLWKWPIMIGGLNSMRSNSFLDFKGIILDCR